MASIVVAPVVRGPQDYAAQSDFNRRLVHALSGGLNYVNLATGGVRTANLADLVATTAKIDDLAVTTAKVDNLAVTTAKIDNLAVTTAKIDNLAVTTAKIDNLAVTNAKIDSMEAGKVTAGTITATIEIIGPTITGGTVRTAASGKRMELTTSGLVAWLDGSNKGVSIENDAFGQIKFNGSNGFLASVFGDLYMGTGYGANINIWSDGDLEASADASTGTLTLKDSDYTRTLAQIVEHTHSIGSAGSHNHGISNGTELALASGGSVTWVAYSGHTHSIT